MLGISHELILQLAPLLQDIRCQTSSLAWRDDILHNQRTQKRSCNISFSKEHRTCHRKCYMNATSYKVTHIRDIWSSDVKTTTSHCDANWRLGVSGRSEGSRILGLLAVATLLNVTNKNNFIEYYGIFSSSDNHGVFYLTYCTQNVNDDSYINITVYFPCCEFEVIELSVKKRKKYKAPVKQSMKHVLKKVWNVC